MTGIVIRCMDIKPTPPRQAGDMPPPLQIGELEDGMEIVAVETLTGPLGLAFYRVWAKQPMKAVLPPGVGLADS